ncbi:helix-turn-helix domain-containing protein [Actinomycetes bacterium KLBMP 9759]
MSSQQAQPAAPAFYTAPETAVIFRIDDSTIYRHLRNGTFPGIKIGGRYIVPGAVIDRLIADVLATGRCIDLEGWTQHWRNEQAAVIARLAAADVLLPGGAL